MLSPSSWLLCLSITFNLWVKARIVFNQYILSNPNKNFKTLRSCILIIADDVIHTSSLTQTDKKDKKSFMEFVLKLVWRDWGAIDTMKDCGVSLRKRQTLGLLF